VPGKKQNVNRITSNVQNTDFLVHKIIEPLNIKIMKELVSNPDLSSTDIAIKYHMPLSTIQRRRTRLESSILKKSYRINMTKIGWRTADILVAVEKGKSEQVAKQILQDEKNNVISTSLRIGHPQIDLTARAVYRDSAALHRLIESIKAMPFVTFVEWSEEVKVVGDNYPNVIDLVFSSYL
jgi:DNA-binding Lrp family transcriptional regulator